MKVKTFHNYNNYLLEDYTLVLIDLYLWEIEIKVSIGFNGADTKAIDRIKDNFYPKELPLSICYRCPEKVVRLAQKFVPDIEWNKDRPDKGTLDVCEYDEMKAMGTWEDFASSYTTIYIYEEEI